MQTINTEATAFFAALLSRMGDHLSIVIQKNGQRDLVIQTTNRQYVTPKGNASKYILHQSHPDNNEIKVPEITFLVIDNRSTPGELDKLMIWPQIYVDGQQGVYVDNIIIHKSKFILLLPQLYNETLRLANLWLSHLANTAMLD